MIQPTMLSYRSVAAAAALYSRVRKSHPAHVRILSLNVSAASTAPRSLCCLMWNPCSRTASCCWTRSSWSLFIRAPPSHSGARQGTRYVPACASNHTCRLFLSDLWLQDQEEHANFRQLLQAPLSDAEDLMKARIPLDACLDSFQRLGPRQPRPCSPGYRPDAILSASSTLRCAGPSACAEIPALRPVRQPGAFPAGKAQPVCNAQQWFLWRR